MKPFCIIQLTDLHLFADETEKLKDVVTDESFRTVLSQIERDERPDLIVLSGDLTHYAEMRAYKRLAEYCHRFVCPIIAVPGNHDLPNEMQQAFAGTKVQAETKHLLVGGWSLIFLNTFVPRHEHGQLDATELTFLQETLSQHTEPTVIFLHHPLLHVGIHKLDIINIQNSKQVLDIIYQYGHVKLTCSGHVHLASHCYENGIDFYTSPSTCYQQKPPTADGSDCHWMLAGYRPILLSPDGSHHTQIMRVQ